MNELTDEAVCACTLNRIFGYRPGVARQIVDALGSASAIFKLRNQEIRDIFGPWNKDSDKISLSEIDISRKELLYLSEKGYRFLPITDPLYPPLLKDSADAPMGLYIRSDSATEDIFTDSPCISVVGTRDISMYGSEWCVRTVAALSQAKIKPVIVSGMAVGVDITAHMAALGHRLPTIGVLPTGIDSMYPRQHVTAAAKIAATPGCALITDFPPGTSPQKVTFLRRNRIIAGLSRATILIESRRHGGGLITARLAFEYNRQVFALPGRVDDQRSEGCNMLVKEMLAEPLSTPEDLVEQLSLGTFTRSTKKGVEEETRELFRDLPPAELEETVRVATAVRSFRGITVDEICSRLNLPYNRVSVITGRLENAGLISMDLMQRCSISVRKV